MKKKIKVSEATNIQLDWLVAKCAAQANNHSYVITPAGKLFINSPLKRPDRLGAYFPSTNWSQGGPIIERERINLNQFQVHKGSVSNYFWEATSGYEDEPNYQIVYGPTLLIAAMRCYVISKLGAEVKVPDEI